jgi:hypothetical protein
MSRPPDALSPQSITQLSDFDNYEIYSIIAACLPAVTATRYYRGYVGENWVNNIRVSASPAEIAANSNPSGYYTRTQAVYSANTGDGGYKYDDFVFDRFIGANYAPGQYFENTSAKARKLYAIQTYSPKYQVDFTGIKSVMDAYAPKIGSGWIIGVNGYRAVQWFTPVSEFDWSKLAVDGRLKFSGISDSDGVLIYSYWAHNPLEQHPQINLTCDYRSHTIAVSQGKPFTIDLHYPIAQTLKISNSLLAGILVEQFSDVTGNKPANFAEYLIGSTAYAFRIEQLYPPPPADPIPIQPPNDDRVIRESWNKQLLPSGGNVGGWIYKLDGTVIGRENPDTTTGRAIYTSPTLEYQILPAENDLWGQGATLPTYAPFNCSIPDLPVGITYDRLHFEPQTDGSFGELIMDSPRTIENNEMLKKILAALGAEVYATDPETGEPRTWNLGKIIESIGNFCGLRRQPNGKFLTTTEADKYKRTRLSNPTWAAGAYDTKQWGNKGFAMRFLPTQYKEGQRQDTNILWCMICPKCFWSCSTS